MPKKLKDHFLVPGDGGKLITDVEQTQVAAASYRNKLNWRRETGAEVRSEGFVKFYPKTEIGPMLQAFPAQHYAKRSSSISGGFFNISFESRAGYTYILFFSTTVDGNYHDSTGLAHIVGDGTVKTFAYPTTDPPGFFQVGGYKTVEDPIIFVGTLNRANGDKTVIAATATEIFRFYAYNNQDYFYQGNHDDGYFESIDGEWVSIGSGFSASTTRWEGVLINSTLVMNNGHDLPVRHRFDETEVVPLYELRDNGIARVGTIAEISDILVCGDIYQLDDTTKDSITLPLEFAGVTAQQVISGFGSSVTNGERLGLSSASAALPQAMKKTGNTIVSTSGPAFGASDVGSKVYWVDDDAYDIIEEFVDTETVRTVTYDSHDEQDGLIKRAGTHVSGYSTTGSTVLVDGKIIRWPNGLRGTLSGIVVSAMIGDIYPINGTLDVSDLISPELTFTVQDDVDSNYHVTTSEDVFTEEMVGQSILFDSGEERKIIEFIDAQTVKVNKDDAIASTSFRITNPDQYSQQDGQDRYSYRVVWSAIDMPWMFAANATAAVEAGSRTIVLANPVKWVECGCDMTITGVGVNGSNLTAAIQSVSHGNTVIRISEVPSVSSDAAVCQSTAQIGNIVGYDELDQDSRAILKMVPISRERLIVYKEMLDGIGSIFTMQFNGSTETPFTVEKVFEGAEVPAFSEAIVSVMGEWHLYPGANSFYRFDQVTQRPDEITTFRLMERTFYDEVTRVDPHKIFARLNPITKEVFLFYPSTTDTKCIRYDYRNNSISLSDMSARCAAMVRRPNDDEEWFLFGNDDGTITRYGLVDDDVIAITASQTGTTVTGSGFRKEFVDRTIRWGDKTHVAVVEFIDDTTLIVDTSSEQDEQLASILPGVWHRDGESYDSILESGLDHFNGEGWNQVMLERYAPRFGVFQPCTVTLIGAKQSDSQAEDVKTKAISSATMVPTMLVRHYWGDRISVTGKNNPCSIIGRNFRPKVIANKGFRT